MGLNLKKWLLEKLNTDVQKISSEDITANEMLGVSAEFYTRELAFWQCVHLIANAINKCEFKTYLKGKEVKGDEYYLWNIEPNKNQSSSVFLHKLIAKLYANNEALIVQSLDGKLLVADSYSKKEYALLDDIFTQVSVGNFSFNQSFQQSEVIYLKLHSKNMRPLVNGLYESYKSLIEYGMKSYRKSRGTKGTLEISTAMTGNPKFTERFAELKNNGFKNFAEAENAILPLYEGYNYTDLGSKTYSSEGTRDIRAMIDDVSDFTARAFGIPPVLLSGDVQGVADALDQFLTFCIDPLTDMIAEEINRKRSGKAVLNGTYLQIDTKCVKHVDLLSVSTAIDKLIASGAFCINDIRELVGEAHINEEWAYKHFMTKNYSTVSDLLDALEKGEMGGK